MRDYSSSLLEGADALLGAIEQHFANIDHYFDTGEFEDAIILLLKVLALKRDHYTALVRLGDAFLYLMDLSCATHYYSHAYSIAPSPELGSRVAALLFFEGLQSIERQEYLRAHAFLTEATDFTPDNPIIIIRSIQCLLALGDFTGAMATAGQRQQVLASCADGLVLLAYLSARGLAFQEAVTLLDMASQKDPRHVACLELRKVLQSRAVELAAESSRALQSGEYVPALAAVSAALSVNPDDIALLVDRASIHASFKNSHAALGDLKTALQRCSKPELLDATTQAGEIRRAMALVLNELGVSAVTENRYEDAISLLSEAAEYFPAARLVFTNRGDVYQREGMLSLAIEDYRTALRLAQHELEHVERSHKLAREVSLVNLDKVHLTLRDAQAIVWDAKTRLALCLYVRGTTEFNNSRFRACVETISEAIELNNKVLGFYMLRANASALARDFSMAERDLRYVLELSPGNEEAKQLLWRLVPTAKPTTDVHQEFLEEVDRQHMAEVMEGPRPRPIMYRSQKAKEKRSRKSGKLSDLSQTLRLMTLTKKAIKSRSKTTVSSKKSKQRWK